jgi:excinuclease ABC subunit A
VDPQLVINNELSIKEGGIKPFSNMFEHDTWYSRLMLKVCEEAGIDARTPIKNLSKDEKDIILYGTGDKEYKVQGTNRFGHLTYIWEKYLGVVLELEKRYRESDSDFVKAEIEKYMREFICPECSGNRLKPEALAVTINNISIADFTRKPVVESIQWLTDLTQNKILNGREIEISKPILREITERLNFLVNVGLDYLTIDRNASSLSGGEGQRIRLASQIGSGLSGVLYVLDEPTIGLHPRDDQKLIDALKKLRNLGNSVVVVEHDKEMMEQSDFIFDFGPGAGETGGNIVAQGTINQIKSNPNSITGKYLSGKKKIKVTSEQKLLDNQKYLTVEGCDKYNLKNITVDFPLEKLVVITGVSGSGKSTLLVETLYPALNKNFNQFYRDEVTGFSKLSGVENIDKVILIDQSPIGKTPRSNPATYTGAFNPIRDLFSSTKEAKTLGYKKGRFSFNLKGGRCDTCEGQGQIKIEMQFMSDLWVECEVCHGKRYNSSTLEVTYRGKNIAEVLNMSVIQAKEFFHGNPQIMAKLDTLDEVGLGYMKLGQPATTVSGGEAQRIKLATELSKKSTGRTVYILDEPTTGLHFVDVEKLLLVLRKLVNMGNSVFIIEHNPDIVKNADWIIDMGPEGGEMGGEIIAQGSVRDVAKNTHSYTGKYLAKI